MSDFRVKNGGRAVLKKPPAIEGCGEVLGKKRRRKKEVNKPAPGKKNGRETEDF